MTGYISSGDIFKVGTSAKLADLINLLISTLHMLMYDPSMNVSRNLYSARTRKIVLYSNMIATGSKLYGLAAICTLGMKMPSDSLISEV